MKKILILVPKHIYEINGTSNYAYKLCYFLLNEKYIIDVFYFYESNKLFFERELSNANLHFLEFNNLKRKNELNETINGEINEPNILLNASYIKNITKFFLDNVNLSQYDLIIDCTFYFDKKIMNLNNYLFVQQFEPKFYETKIYQKCEFNNPFIYAKNLVLYDHYQLEKYFQDKKYFFIPLCSYNLNFIQQNYKKTLLNLKEKYEKGKIIYIGRINNHQKNISFINELNDKYHEDIEVYGPIENNTLVSNYKNKLDRTDVIKKLNQAKFMILVSKTEGFSYSLVESISLCTPVIIRNSYPSAKYLVSFNNGILIPKEYDAKEASILIDKLKNISFAQYEALVKNCFKFASSELSTNEFEKKWKDVIYFFINNSFKE